MFINLKMQLGLAASEGKNILQQYSQQSKAFASEIWGRLGLEKLKENLHQLWLVCVTLSKEIRRNATEFPKTVFDSFIKALGKQCKQTYFINTAKSTRIDYRDQTKYVLCCYRFYSGGNSWHKHRSGP